MLQKSMLKRWSLPLALLVATVAAPLPAQAQMKPPTVRIQVKSLDTVVDNLKLLVALAGREELANQVEGLVKSKIGEDGLEGIDPKRPLGVYGRFGKDLNDVSGVLMLPIASEKAFLTLLTNLNLQADKNDKGVYNLQTPAPVPITFRFANKYAYFTAMSLDTLDKLLPPEEVFSATQKGALGMVLHIDQFPEAMRFIAKAQLEQKLQEAQDKEIPNETEAQKALRLQVAKTIMEHVSMVLDDAKVLTLDIAVDKKAGELDVAMTLSAKPDSKLAKHLKEYGSKQSVLAGLSSKEAALQGAVRFDVPPELHKSLEMVFEEAQQKTLAKVDDVNMRDQLKGLYAALKPTVQAGMIDAAIAVHGPDASKHVTVIAGVQMKNGMEVGKKTRDLIADISTLLPPAEKAKIKLDFASVGDVKIHQFDFSQSYDGNAKKMFGDSPLFLAFRDDALLVAVGPKALPVLKAGLMGKAGAAQPFHFDISVAQLVPLLGKKGQEAIKAFSDGNAGMVRFTITGGDQLQINLRTQLSVVQFASKMASAAKN